MRCIEIDMFCRDHTALIGLTLTWDVLKYDYKKHNGYYHSRLTLTWDVLKYYTINILIVVVEININMRCIEMPFLLERTLRTLRLTLTWDVLK